MKLNRRSDAPGFPGDGKPPRAQSASAFPGDEPPDRPIWAAGFSDDGNDPARFIVRDAIDDAISSLGGSVHKTIIWHMKNRGVFADPKKIDISFYYDNLRQLLGPGADMIMEDTWENLHKRHKVE